MNLSRTEQSLADALQRRGPVMLEDLRTLVAIPTGGAYAPGLDETRGLLIARLERLGAATRLIPGDPKPDWIDRSGPALVNPPTAFCIRAQQSARCRVLLGGHLDTVHDPGGPFRRLDVDASGNRATGPGCIDMKGGLVIALHALEALAEVGVNAHWGFVLNSDEETGSYHSDAALRAVAKDFDAGLIFEPALPDGGLVVERPGSGQFYIETKGVAAHVGRDFRHGVSAILGMAECVREIADMADPDRGLIASTGIIEGGTATNIVPDRCRAWGNVRYKDNEVAAEIEGRLAAMERPEAVAGVHILRSFNRPAKPLTPGTQLLADLARGASEDLGKAMPFGKTGGVCDGNNFQAAGLATIDTLGVRGGAMHTKDEWIDLTSLVDRACLTAVLISRLAEGRLGESG